VHLRAKIIASVFAVLAATTRITRFDGDAVPNFEGCDCGANFMDGARGLVTLIIKLVSYFVQRARATSHETEFQELENKER
jgi:hypothetical protein